LLRWIELVHYIIHELLKLCTPKKFLRIGPDAIAILWV